MFASPPVKLGISARCVSAMLTMTIQTTGPSPHKRRRRSPLRERRPTPESLRIVRRVLDLSPEDSAGRVDFLHRELDAVVKLVPAIGACAEGSTGRRSSRVLAHVTGPAMASANTAASSLRFRFIEFLERIPTALIGDRRTC
jgi:hypothetical protein